MSISDPTQQKTKLLLANNLVTVHTCTVKRNGCFDSIWLPQFPTSSASLNTVESHCLLCIPTMLRFSGILVNVMGECFANEILQRCGKVWNWGKQNNPVFLTVCVTTVEPPTKKHFGSKAFVLFSEVVLWWEVQANMQFIAPSRPNIPR